MKKHIIYTILPLSKTFMLGEIEQWKSNKVDMMLFRRIETNQRGRGLIFLQ